MSYLTKIKSGAIKTWHTHKVLPSVTGAQAILESGWGSSKLAKPPHNNQFGIKASADWTGRTVSMPTKEYVNGAYVTVTAKFRSYDNIDDSIVDHGAFFTSTEWRRNNYRHVVGERDYKKASRALQSAGYATDPGYANKLIDLIERNNLQAWDTEALNNNSVAPRGSNSNLTTGSRGKSVGGNLTSTAQNHVRGMKVSVIGDSLGVGTKPHLEKLIPGSNYDVVGSRQITHSTNSLNGTRALQTMKNNGSLQTWVVVILGTNRGLTKSEMREFMNICGSERRVVWVDTASQVGHRDRVRDEVAWVSTEFQNAFSAHWSRFAQSNMSAWFTRDGAGGTYIHMTSAGYKKHAEFIAQALYEASEGSFQQPDASTTAGSAEVTQIDIREADLDINGTLKYPDANGVIQTMNIGYKGFYSPEGDPNIYHPEANARWGEGGNINSSTWIEGYYDVENESDIGQLVIAGVKELKERSEPNVQYTISLLDMDDDVSVGDTGIFVDHRFNPPLYIQARIVDITTSLTNPSLNKVTISNVIELEAQDKSDIIRLQNELRSTREGLIREWREGGPTELVLESLGGLLLTPNVKQVDLLGKLMQGEREITEAYTDYRWERHTSNLTADNNYNEIMRLSNGFSALNVTRDDLVDDEALFILRVYDDRGLIVASAGVTIRYQEPAKSAFETWKEFTNKPNATMEEYVQFQQGKDGKDGVQGPPGDDGQSQYFHTAWAVDPFGKQFSIEPFEGATYMGTAVTNTPSDPRHYSAYEWVFVKGDPSYTHVAYGNKDENGNIINFSLTETNREFKGYLYTTEKEPSKDPRDYKWEQSVHSLQSGIDEVDQRTSGEIYKILESQSVTLDKVEALNTELNITKENAIIRHSAEYIENIQSIISKSGSYDDAVKSLEQYARYIDTFFVFDDAFTIGRSNSKNKVRITNEQLQFLDGETVLAFLSGTYFNAQNIAVIGNLEVGVHKVAKEGPSGEELTVFRWIGVR